MDENNDEARLVLDLGLGLNDYSKPKKVDYNSHNNKPKSFLGLSIPIHTSNHGVSEINGFSSNSSKEADDDDFSCRKKLRLNRDQITLLEDCFKQHTTLNTAKKHELAEKLNLKPRQVEVWFQNRRARTKLKQTEVDCELLKRNCERLSEENWRLKKELLELRSLMKTPAAQAQPHFCNHNHEEAADKEKNRGGGEMKEDGL
ncbi:hypothetical protein CASFOL_019307 [Castilleja foliolosa]|uniref:Homeobox domain-containing protein n=1 Tax=Castilleja foliolosa TaxID=1961234 RepID=A0ABD3D4P3_9LAMI